MPHTSLGPTPEQFDELFPYHVVLDVSGTVRQVGRALRQLCPSILPSTVIDDHFIVERPILAHWGEAIEFHLRDLFILRLRDRDLRFRGQILRFGPSLIAFAGSPWITDLRAAQDLGILVEHLAIHDPSLDLILAIQAQRIAASDHQRLVQRLKVQKAELQRAISQLKASEAEARKLAHVAARTHSAVIITNPTGQIEWVNDGFTRITGYDLSEVVGHKPGSFLQGPETDPATVHFIRERLSSQEGFRCALVNYSKDRRRYWVEMEVQPVRNEQGDIAHYIAIEQDITDRQEEEERNRLQKEISTALAESDSLDAGVLQAVIGFAKALRAQAAGCWPAEDNCLEGRSIAFWSASAPANPTHASSQSLLASARTLGLCAITRNDPSLHRCSSTQTRFLVIPCRAAGRNVAAILLSGPELSEPADDLIQLLAVLGNLVGQFIVRTQTRQALEQSRNFALQVMSLMGQGLTVSDENGRLTFVNQAFASMVGIAPLELIGRSPGEFSSAADQVHLNTVWQDRRSGVRSSYELTLTSANGSRIPVLISGVPRMEQDAFAGTIAVITDLTEQKRVQEQMASSLERERELNRLKTAFVTMASHEFRTPLASITYAGEMLSNFVRFLPEDRAPKGHRYVAIVLESAQRMGELMDDLLLLGRIESGRLTCAPIQVELCVFAEELRQEVRQNSHRIQLDLPPTLPTHALLDPNLLRHSLVNLLSNALKYSPPESDIRFAILPPDPSAIAAEWSFIVQDFGCGIPTEDQQQIFQPFFRASNVGKVRGTGIGLTIARDCARLHGGELSFRSAPSQGTTFTLRIPVAQPRTGPA